MRGKIEVRPNTIIESRSLKFWILTNFAKGDTVSPILGLAGIVGSLYFVFTFDNGGFQGYFDIPSAVLLGVAPPSIMLLSHNLSDFFTGIKLLFGAVFSSVRKQQGEVIGLLTTASKAVRSDGMCNVSTAQLNCDDPQTC